MRRMSLAASSILVWGSLVQAGPPRPAPFHLGDVPPAVLVDGARRATIVVPAQAAKRVRLAAALLAETVEAITGARLTLATDAEAPAGPVVHVGPTGRVQALLGEHLRVLDADGYILLSTPEGLCVVGGSEHGTFFAASMLLQKYAGVRWLWPGDLGRVVPKADRLVLRDVNLIDEPAYRSRYMSGVDEEWMYRNRMRCRHNFHHNLNLILDSSKYGKTHPEFYPLVGGRREVPPPQAYDWQPCMSNPEVVKTVADTVIRLFDESNLESYSVGNADGAGWCNCPACQAMDERPAGPENPLYSGSNTQRVYRFFNQVAERVAARHPDRLLGCLAYAAYMAPPVGFRVHPMILPYLTSTRDGYVNPEFKRGDQALLEAWCRVTRQMGIYEYHYGMGFLVPRIYINVLADALRHAHAHGTIGFYAEAYANWALDGPKLYATAHLTWNPLQDPKAIVEDFCRTAFGPAAGPMIRHFTRCEEAWCRARVGWGQTWSWPGVGDPRQFLAYTPEVIEASIRDMEEAARLAGGDARISARVAFFRKAFEVVRLGAPSVASLRLLEQGEPIAKVLQALAETKDPRPQIDAYWKQHYAGDTVSFFPAMVQQVGGGGWGLDAARVPEADVKLGLVHRLVTEAVQAVRSVPGHEFSQRLRQTVEASVNRGLPTVEPGTPLARIRDELIAWASKACAARRVTQAPTIDGRLDEACWSSAGRAGGFSAHDALTETPVRTEFAACHDGRHLYLAFWCYQAKAEVLAHAGGTEPDTPAYRDNSIEMFFNRDQPNSPFHQVIVNAAGGVFDMRANNAAWTLQGLRKATAVADDLWTLEVAVPLEAIGLKLPEDRLVRFNAARNRVPGGGQKQQVSAWFPARGWLNDFNNRGWLVLE